MTLLHTLTEVSDLLIKPEGIGVMALAIFSVGFWGVKNFSGAPGLGGADKAAASDLPTLHDASSIAELERLFRRFSQPQNQIVVYRRFAEQAGIALTAQEIWLLQRLSEIVGATEEDLPIALRLTPERLARPLASLQAAGLVTTGCDSLCLTDAGRAALVKMNEAKSRSLDALLSEWAPGGHYEIQKIIERFTRKLNAEMPPEDGREAL